MSAPGTAPRTNEIVRDYSFILQHCRQTAMYMRHSGRTVCVEILRYTGGGLTTSATQQSLA